MSQFHVVPSQGVAGRLTVPGDKSISHRALMLGAIAEGTTQIEGILESEDCLATLSALQRLGVVVRRPGPGRVAVDGVGLTGLRAPHVPLDMGNAGTAMRLFMGLLAPQAFDSVLIGDRSLMQRPMERAAGPLRAMGARIDTNEGRPPVRIGGGARLRGQRLATEVPSAQVKSALLLAALYADAPTTVIEPTLTRDHTERMLRSFGCELTSRDGRTTLQPPPRLRATRILVPTDFSSAAFFIVAGCIAGAGPLIIEGVGVNPTRTGLLEMLSLMGADLCLINHRNYGAEPVADIEVRPARLHGIDAPARLVPLAIDELPAFFIAAACASGVTTVSGAAELRVKESDRIAAMAHGLAALGIRAQPSADGIRIEGGQPTGGVVESVGDHRVAMSFAIAALRASGPVEIREVDNVANSFPGFAATARSVGINIRSQPIFPKNGSGPVSVPAPKNGSEPTLLVTIDGPGGSGKGTVGRRVANRLGWHLLDSGALYRLVALAGLDAGLASDDEVGHSRLALNLDVQFTSDSTGNEAVLLAGKDVTARLRTEEAGMAASRVAAMPSVRTALLDRQRAFARPPGLVADGRDMGTIVFPDAGLKIYLTASAEERARRRHNQLKEKGLDVSLAALSQEIRERDHRDSSRAVAPLRPAEDAVVIDSTGIPVEGVVDAILALVGQRFPAAH
jgi:3-phosphoshikimate 1-carboxyvinyltransferase